MTIIRKATETQVDKLFGKITMDALQSQSYACSGECWDCDSSGGSQTH